MATDSKTHWEHIYQTKSPEEVSWTQQIPEISLKFIHTLNLPKPAKIIDVGGGDSKLVDYLLEEGYENISVLDISSKALEKAKNRLGNQAEKVTWIVSDILEFQPDTTYDLWHDRATFHFLTQNDEIKQYLAITKKVVKDYLVMGTFSDQGPDKCSGLDIRQYSENQLEAVFGDAFTKINCQRTDHVTPSGDAQNFLFCSFRKK